MFEKTLERIKEKLSKAQELTEDSISVAVDTATDEVLNEFLSDCIPGFDLNDENPEEWDEDWLKFIEELKNYKKSKCKRLH